MTMYKQKGSVVGLREAAEFGEASARMALEQHAADTLENDDDDRERRARTILSYAKHVYDQMSDDNTALETMYALRWFWCTIEADRS